MKSFLRPMTSRPPLLIASTRAPTDSSLVLVWTSMGEPCTREAAGAFEVRITEDWRHGRDWSEMEPLLTVEEPRGTGLPEYQSLGNLRQDREYFFGIRASYPALGLSSYHFTSGRTTNCGTPLPEAAPFLMLVLDPAQAGLGVDIVSMDSDGTGRLFLLDGGTRHVRRFTPGSGVEAEWSVPTRLGELRRLVCGSDGLVYLEDIAGRIFRVTAEGESRGEIPPPANDTQVSFNNDFTVNAAGAIFQVNELLGRIQKRSPEGTVLLTWGPNNNRIPKSLYPGAVALAPNGDVVVVDTHDGTIHNYLPDTGQARPPLAWPIQCTGAFEDLADFTIGRDGAFYVVETTNGRVVKLGSDGSMRWTWGGSGRGRDRLEEPQTVAQGERGVLYVLDKEAWPGTRQNLRVLVTTGASSVEAAGALLRN